MRRRQLCLRDGDVRAHRPADGHDLQGDIFAQRNGAADIQRASLQIGDQRYPLLFRIACREQSVGGAESRRVSGFSRARLDPLKRGAQHRLVAAQLSNDLSVAFERHQRRALPGRKRVDALTRGRRCLLPPFRVTHAVGAIQQDYQVAFDGRCALRLRAGIQVRRGKGHDHGGEREAAKRKQQGVADPAPTLDFERNPAHEHQRREFAPKVLVALHQMNQHRHRQCRESQRQPGVEQAHQRTLASRARLER